MRRIYRFLPFPLSRGVMPIDISAFSNQPGSGGGDASTAHPLLYSVPVLASRTIGRDSEVKTLWQNLLSGSHFQALVGVDGVGKSTLAAEFCDCVRHSQRFTCIQWFNGQHKLEPQLQQFFRSMQTRKEKDVLLILDDVQDIDEVGTLLPMHENLYVLITTSQPLNGSPHKLFGKVTIIPTQPLLPASSRDFASAMESPESADVIFSLLGQVPLLLHIAALLLEHCAISAPELQRVLEEQQVMRDNTLSVSRALQVLLGIAVGKLEKLFFGASDSLCVIACFHLSDISDGVVSAVMGDSGGNLAAAASQLGVLSLKWEDSAYAMHPAVACVLRGTPTPAQLERASRSLATLWPRRWRGAGSHVAYNLVWHTYAIFKHFEATNTPLCASLVESMNKSSVLLAHHEFRDLEVAMEMWYCVHQYYTQADSGKGAAPTVESARVSMECGRLMHFLRDLRAEEVLRAAYAQTVSVYGKNTPESALVVACMAPYLMASQKNVEMLSESVNSLEVRLSSVDVVLSKEETHMILESMLGMLMRKGQMLAELDLQIPESLWARLDAVDTRLKKV